MEQRWISHAVKEIRSVRSLNGLKNLNRKLLFLMFRARGDFVRGTEVPPSLQIEPTNNCNLRCICCSGYSNERKRGYMELPLFRSIIDEAADIGVRRIHLYLHGEPLLHPRIGEMLRHIKSRRLAVTLATNAMLLDEEKIADVMGAGMTNADYILLSVLGFSRQTHESIQRGVDHDRVLANITRLTEYRNARKLDGPIIETVFYTLPENRGEEGAYRAFWHKKVDHARIARESMQYAELRGGVSSARPRTRTCHHLWERMSIHWDGTAALCVGDIDGKHRLGNLGESSIKDLWNGEEISRIRAFHRKSDFAAIPLCRTCDW